MQKYFVIVVLLCLFNYGKAKIIKKDIYQPLISNPAQINILLMLQKSKQKNSNNKVQTANKIKVKKIQNNVLRSQNISSIEIKNMLQKTQLKDNITKIKKENYNPVLQFKEIIPFFAYIQIPKTRTQYLESSKIVRLRTLRKFHFPIKQELLKKQQIQQIFKQMQELQQSFFNFWQSFDSLELKITYSNINLIIIHQFKKLRSIVRKIQNQQTSCKDSLNFAKAYVHFNENVLQTMKHVLQRNFQSKKIQQLCVQEKSQLIVFQRQLKNLNSNSNQKKQIYLLAESAVKNSKLTINQQHLLITKAKDLFLKQNRQKFSFDSFQCPPSIMIKFFLAERSFQKLIKGVLRIAAITAQCI